MNIISRSTAALTLGIAMLVPGLAFAQIKPSLVLSPADTDHDGIVTDAEYGAHLGAQIASGISVSRGMNVPAPRREPPVLTLGFGPRLATPGSLEGRIVPATEFETALNHRFETTRRKAR
jgi:hypothetical protein